MNRPEDAPHAFQAAWNSHDMASLGTLFHEDATFVNRFGHYVHGVAQIVDLHAPIHATIYRDSTLVNELIDVVAIRDDAATVHFWSRLMAGAAHPAGPHAGDTLILAVLTRQAGEWRIKALENVTLTNPRTGEAVLRDERALIEQHGIASPPYRAAGEAGQESVVIETQTDGGARPWLNGAAGRSRYLRADCRQLHTAFRFVGRRSRPAPSRSRHPVS